MGINDLSELGAHARRTGIPRGIHGSRRPNSPAYATSVGLLHWALRDQRERNGTRKAARHQAPEFEFMGVVAAAQKWIKTLIPK
jgi:hypothetical protein